MSTKTRVTEKVKVARPTSGRRMTRRTAATVPRGLLDAQDDAKAAVLFYLNPVLRFESALGEAGFTDVHMTETEEPEVWEVRMTRAPATRRPSSSNVAKRLRQIAEVAHCPIPPGLLVAVAAGRKVLATFKAPAIG